MIMINTLKSSLAAVAELSKAQPAPPPDEAKARIARLRSQFDEAMAQWNALVSARLEKTTEEVHRLCLPFLNNEPDKLHHLTRQMADNVHRVHHKPIRRYGGESPPDDVELLLRHAGNFIEKVERVSPALGFTPEQLALQ